MSDDHLYKKGYAAGYWAGVQDALSGTVTDWRSSDIRKLPIQAMGISSRACNCLMFSGCTHVEDLFSLSGCDIARMRNVGRKTASEIAKWLTEQGILDTAWSEFL